MATPFIGEVRMFGFTFAPRGWAFCQGQLLSIAQNTALFSILGTTYGGNGQTNFGLPDLRGRTPIHPGNGGGGSYALGELSGEENHLLLATEMPQHTHLVACNSAAATAPLPTGNFWAASTSQIYTSSAAAASATTKADALASAGGSQSHTNMQPYLVLNFSIALQGIFPSRN